MFTLTKTMKKRTLPGTEEALNNAYNDCQKKFKKVNNNQFPDYVQKYRFEPYFQLIQLKESWR